MVPYSCSWSIQLQVTANQGAEGVVHTPITTQGVIGCRSCVKAQARQDAHRGRANVASVNKVCSCLGVGGAVAKEYGHAQGGVHTIAAVCRCVWCVGDPDSGCCASSRSTSLPLHTSNGTSTARMRCLDAWWRHFFVVLRCDSNGDGHWRLVRTDGTVRCVSVLRATGCVGCFVDTCRCTTCSNREGDWHGLHVYHHAAARMSGCSKVKARSHAHASSRISPNLDSAARCGPRTTYMVHMVHEPLQ